MSTTLSKGYVVPANGEKGTWFPQLENNITRLNNHTHDGIDSFQIPMKNISRNSEAVVAAGWIASGEATGWKQTITLPSGLSFDTCNIVTRMTTGGDLVHPKIVKLTSTTFELYVNDNTLNLTIVYA